MNFLNDLIGGPANGRLVLMIGGIVVILAALPELIPTLLALLKLLPIKESVLENLNTGVKTAKQWSGKTRLIMAILGVLVMISGGAVVLGAGPVAQEDQVFTSQGTPVRFNVLVNDRDPDGSSITLINWSKISRFGGDVQCSGEGVCTYTPPLNLMEGIDNFTYDIAYGNNGNKKATGVLVTIQVNPAPTSTITLTPTASLTPIRIPSNTPTVSPTTTSTPTPTATETQATIEVQTTTAVPSTTTPATPSPTPTSTFASGEAILVTQGYIYVRPGPGKYFGAPLGTLDPEVTVLILGVSPDSFWWQIQCPAMIEPATYGCWVTSDPAYSTSYNAENVPVIPLPPTPTPAG